MFRAIRKKLFRLALVSGAGAAANYFFDKDRGVERRNQLKDKASGLMGKSSGGATWQPHAEHSANGFEPQVVGATVPSTPAPTVSDVIVEPTLAPPAV
ncbi:MAG TPA: hypothetical protein VJ653_07725 [Acidimicrobiales bacterium]|nr:hypothetical protein [Acidimicrobiales bacterium]